MHAIIIRVVLLLVFLTSTAVRAEEGWGVGVILGEPTGLSVKKWTAPDRAFDAAAAWSFSDHDSFQFHADYLIHHFDILEPAPTSCRVAFYYGAGGRVKLRDNNDHGNDHAENDDRVGLRIPFGLTCLFNKTPLEFFAELAPILDVVPETEGNINGAFGLRYYFR